MDDCCERRKAELFILSASVDKATVVDCHKLNAAALRLCFFSTDLKGRRMRRHPENENRGDEAWLGLPERA